MEKDECQPFRFEYYKKLKSYLESRLKDGLESKPVKYIEDFYVILCNLELEESLDRNTREKINLTLNYFASPIDVLPEAVFGTYGFYDDICLSAHLIKEMYERYNVEINKSRKMLGLFKGETVVLPQLMKTIIEECCKKMNSEDFENLKHKFPEIFN